GSDRFLHHLFRCRFCRLVICRGYQRSENQPDLTAGSNMSESSDKVVCKTPTPDKSAKQIDKWKYDVVRRAILNILKSQPDGVLFSELATLVGQNLSEYEKQNLGSVNWHTTTVKLDLEVRGEIRRFDKVHPQKLVIDYVEEE